MSKSKRANAALATGAVLGIIGICAGIYKWIAGEQVTGLSSLIIWGLEAAGIYTAAACGAGLLTFVGAREFSDDMTDEERGHLLAGAIAAFLTTGFIVLIDLSNPVNILGIVTSFAVTSFMTWDFYMLSLATIVAIVYFVATRRGRASRKTARCLGVVSVVVAICVIVVEAMMTTSVLGRDVWANGLTIVEFLLGALVGGAAFTAIVTQGRSGWLSAVLEQRRPEWLIAAVGSGALVVCMLCELLASSDAAALITSPFLWIGIVALVACTVLGFTRKYPVVNMCCATLGVLCEKVWVLAYGQTSHLFAADTFYSSSPVEWCIVIGMLGLGVFLYELIAKAVPHLSIAYAGPVPDPAEVAAVAEATE